MTNLDPNMIKLIMIHCFKNDIKKLPYYENLKEVICDYEKIKLLSKKYSAGKSTVDKKGLLQIVLH